VVSAQASARDLKPAPALATASSTLSRAQARGVRFGRKLKLTAHQRQEAIARREAGEALVDIGRSYNVSHSTISRLKSEVALRA
jgi:hypothetical protein